MRKVVANIAMMFTVVLIALHAYGIKDFTWFEIFKPTLIGFVINFALTVIKSVIDKEENDRKARRSAIIKEYMKGGLN